MTVRTWSRLFWQSLGAAAVVAAAQWGIGYGLGLIDWGQPFEAGNENAWNSMLTWTAFISAVSVLGGAATGGPGIQRPNHRVKLNARLTAAIAAGLGATAALPVAWLPARVAHPPISEGFTVTIAAAEGIIVGVLLATLALSLATAATSLVATVAWAWSVALACCAVAITRGDPTNHVRLGVLDAGSLIPPNAWWFGPELMIGLAVLLGAATAAAARRRGTRWLGILASGLAGPALIAAVYGIGGPGVSIDHRDQFQPYLAALLGAGAALLAASLVVMLRPRRRPAASAADISSPAGSASGSARSDSATKADARKTTAGKSAAGKAPAVKAGAEAAELEDAKEPASTGKRGKAPARSTTPKPAPVVVPARTLAPIVTTTLSIDDLEVTAKPVKKTRSTTAAPAPAAAAPAAVARSAAEPDEVDTFELELPSSRPASAASARSTPSAPAPSAAALKSSGRSTRGRSGKAAAVEPTPTATTSTPAATPSPAGRPAKPLSKRAARKEEAARREAERKAEAARLLAARLEAAQEAARQEAARKAAAKARRKAPAKRGAVANARRDRLRRSDLDHIDWVRELVHGSDEPEPVSQPDR